MTKDVTVLNRTQKVQIIHRTMQDLHAKIYYLYDYYNQYHENYSEQAMQLYNVYNKYDTAVKNLLTSEEMNTLDDDGLTQMATLSLEVSDLYKLGIRTPDDQKEYEETIKQFKDDVYAEALKRLEENRKEVDTYEKTLLSEVGNKKGENLKPVYQAFDLNAEYLDNEQKKIQAYYAHDNELFSKYYERNNAIQREIEILKSEYPLVKHLTNIKTIVSDINKLCKKIRTAQNNIQNKLTNKNFPIWELNPIIASLFETNEFYDSEKQEYIFDWIKEQKRVDELKDVFKNAIPIALSIMCFFVSGGVSLLVQVLNAAVGTAAAIDDFNDANDLRNMATSQMHISDEAKLVIETSNLSAIEKNYAMAIFSGVFVVADFVDCIKVARKLGIGDEVMDFISKGKTKLSVDETNGLIHKVTRLTTIKNEIKNYAKTIDSWDKFATKACEIGKNTELSDKQKVELLQQLFESSPFKTDINIPSDIRYIKGFDDAGGVIYDWPKCLGYDKKTIQKIGTNNPLPDKWDRYGYLGGKNFSDIPPQGKYSYSQRAIPYVENEAAYHSGVFNKKTYFSKIDCIRYNKRDELNIILKKEGIEIVSKDYFRQLRNQYNDYISDIYDEIGKDFVAPYGVTGYANKWKTMTGGAYQILTPLDGITMKRLGIIK